MFPNISPNIESPAPEATSGTCWMVGGKARGEPESGHHALEGCRPCLVFATAHVVRVTWIDQGERPGRRFVEVLGAGTSIWMGTRIDGAVAGLAEVSAHEASEMVVVDYGSELGLADRTQRPEPAR